MYGEKATPFPSAGKPFDADLVCGYRPVSGLPDHGRTGPCGCEDHIGGGGDPDRSILRMDAVLRQRAVPAQRTVADLRILLYSSLHSRFADL